MSFESLVRPFQTVQTKLPEPAKGSTPLPGQGTEAFISWGGPSTFENLPPNEDLNADDQCSSGAMIGAVTTSVYDSYWAGIVAPPAPATAGKATYGTRAEAEPTNLDPGSQTLAQYWTQEGYTVTGSGDFWVMNPTTKMVTYYSTELAAIQAKENLNVAKQTNLSNTNPDTGPRSPIWLAPKKKKKKPQDKKPGVKSYDEIDRQEEAYTVYKPNDNSVYVNLTRPTSIRFRGPEGEIVKFNYKPPRPPPRPKGPNP
jgi:hypothetical protein